MRDVDKLLAGAYEERAKARAMGKHFADDSAFQGCVHGFPWDGGREEEGRATF